LWEAQFHAMVLPLFRVTDMLIGEMRSRKWGRVLTVASSSVIESSMRGRGKRSK